MLQSGFGVEMTNCHLSLVVCKTNFLAYLSGLVCGFFDMLFEYYGILSGGGND